MPLVASTGGLVDTVKEGVTGFQMGAMDPDNLEEADAGGCLPPRLPAWPQPLPPGSNVELSADLCLHCLPLLPSLPPADAICQTILRAADAYGTPSYTAMRDRCISQDLSWAQPAKKWEAVLTELKYGPGPTPEATADKNSVTTPTQKV